MDKELLKKMENKKHNHYGHRQRIYDKFQNDGMLHEHELLEMLLFNAIPQKNTNDLAHRLLAEFKSIRGVFDASIEELQKVNVCLTVLHIQVLLLLTVPMVGQNT